MVPFRTDLNSDLTAKNGGCRADNTTNIDCNGRGSCLCGQCECIKRDNPSEIVSGKFCECENFSCDRSGGQLCSGPENGNCECGECRCLPGWTGNACDCRETVETCMPPGGGEICSGHGVCECGACKCNANDDGRFSGRYCEHCPTCQGRCSELKECVECLAYRTGTLASDEGADGVDTCQSNCTKFVPIALGPVPVEEKPHEHQCTFYDEDGCKFVFVYTDETADEKLVVRAQEERDCPKPVYVLGLVFGVIAAIVLIGMAILLLWKLLTTIHDRREFAKFEKERSMAKWDTVSGWVFAGLFAERSNLNLTFAGRESDLQAGNIDVQKSHLCGQIRRQQENKTRGWRETKTHKLIFRERYRGDVPSRENCEGLLPAHAGILLSEHLL